MEFNDSHTDVKITVELTDETIEEHVPGVQESVGFEMYDHCVTVIYTNTITGQPRYIVYPIHRVVNVTKEFV